MAVKKRTAPAKRKPIAEASIAPASPLAPDVSSTVKTTAAGRSGKWRVMNRVQLASLMGVHEDTVTDFARNGMPVLRRGGAGKEGQYDVVDCMAWWREQQGKNAKEAAQTRLYQANAQRAETELQRMRGALSSREDVVHAGQAFVKGWTAKILSAPTRMRQIGVITREQEAGVASFCRDILLEISSWKTVADALATETEPAP